MILVVFPLCLSKIGRRTNCGESLGRQGFLVSLSRGDSVRQRELDLGRGVKGPIRTLQISRLDGSGTDDLDGTRTSSVSTGHLIVQLTDGAREGHITELAVHIVGTRSTVITQPDAVVLDDPVVLFNKLNAVDNFTSGLLHLTELMHVVPELGLGNHRVGCKDDHAVGFWVGVFGGGSLAANHMILIHKSSDRHLDGIIVWG